ncbi:uncharacterized protein LOC110810993 isoform X2 [Carica papaya]|nr:uncharacterized protein LOC110810993 isoform X2 [Carica papaya]XP_021893035.1 uncharacterized protein LOC110810993 isoform X2 [Carica papaya]
MMAAAEARALWQRTANRCFVQEDAKRAPKLACCQSSAASAKQVESGPSGAADLPDQSVAGFMPLNRNPSYANLPSDARWWLQLQPDYGFQKGLTSEQLNTLEAKMDTLRTDFENSSSKDKSGLHPEAEGEGSHLDNKNNGECTPNVHSRNSAVCAKHIPKIGENVKALQCENMQELLEVMDTKENYELMGVDSIGCSVSKKANDSSFDPEAPWVCSEKTEPWWRTTDKDELASLVAQKSHDYIANCDLPPPQKMHTRKYPYGNSLGFDRNELSPFNQKSKAHCMSTPIIQSQGSSDLVRTLGRQRVALEDGHTVHGSEQSFSTSQKDSTETQVSENDVSKAQLLEALRHSQTRAREAEKAAKQAYAEKEHIIKLFFKQASQLFAYKQWFQLLQLEALYHQIKNNDQPIPSLFPTAFPWMPCKVRKLQKGWQKSKKAKRAKRSRPSPDVTKYAVAFALGLSLVGAGLLLGWTVGWMLPL